MNSQSQDDLFKLFLKEYKKSVKNKIQFTKSGIKYAKKLFLQNQLEEAKDLLNRSVIKSDGSAPAKCNIVAYSKPFSEWDVVKLNNNIVNFVLSLHKDEVKKPSTDIKSIKEWLAAANIDQLDINVQILNTIIPNAFNIYNGCIEKVKNKNKKNENNKNYKMESAFDEDGYLKNKPFSKNDGVKSFQTCQSFNIHQLNDSFIRKLSSFNIKNIVYSKTKRNSKKEISEIVANCHNQITSYLPIEETIPRGKNQTFDRLSILEGLPGYVPKYHRDLVNLNKKRIKAPATGKPILAYISYKDDWVIIDLRGLLRHANYRKVNFDYTVQGLLNLFTGDPIINIKYNYVQFNFKPNVLSHSKSKEFGYKKRDWLENKEAATIIACDVGANHPLAARISSVSKDDDKIIEHQVYDSLTSQDLNFDFSQISKMSDKIEENINNQAVDLLSPEQKNQYNQWEKSLSSTIDIICDNYKISKSNLNLAEMNNYSCFITNELLKLDPKHPDAFSKFSNKTLKKFDYVFIKDFKPKLEKELREIINSNIWNLKINSDQFVKLSKRKQELSRGLVNKLIKTAQSFNKENKIVFIIENLVKKNNFFSGSGKRDCGYENLLLSKKENRWFINSITKAIEELPFKGYPIVKVPAAYTSQTCIKCNFASKENRSIEDRTLFCCQNCGYKAHADKEIATTNIAQTALLGIALSARPSEYPNDARNLVPARKTAKSKKSKEKLTTPNN